MDLITLTDNISNAVANIDAGRKGFAIRGQEQEGRLSYEDGIAQAMTAFLEAQTSADPQALMLAEYSFITQELALCEKSDTDARNSLTKAIYSFDDAFLALQTVDDLRCEVIDKSFPHDTQYRVSGFPKDSLHIACISHKTRLKNILRFSGIEHIEKVLLKQRLANLFTAQNSYVEKQKKAFKNLLQS